MSGRCEQTSKRTSEWPSTPICILGYSGPQCGGDGENGVSELWLRRKAAKEVAVMTVSMVLRMEYEEHEEEEEEEEKDEEEDEEEEM